MAVSRFIAVFSPNSSQLFEIAPMLSPHVEVCPPDGIVLQVPARYEQDTLNRLSRLADRGIGVGGASSRTAAILAAKVAPGTIIPYNRDQEFLAPLPLSLLATHGFANTRLIHTLNRWGIRTFGELALLPGPELAARLGQEGVLLQRISRGEDIGPLAFYSPAPEFQETRELDWTLESLEPLAFLLSGMIDSLCSRVSSQGFGIETLHIVLQLDDQTAHCRDIRLAFPMQDARVLLSLARLELQAHPPGAAVKGIVLQADVAHPRILQTSLLAPPTPHPEKLSRLLARLKSLAGGDNVGCPAVLDTHRPDALRMEPLETGESETGAKRRKSSHPNRSVQAFPGGSITDHCALQISLRRLRPPQALRLQTEDIVFCAGPWRSSGDWWKADSQTGEWARDEWDVELTNGGIYRIYWDSQQKTWLMEGIYD